MKAVKFKEQNIEMGKDQPQHETLPACRTDDGIIISCWKFTWKEKIKILFGKPIWLWQYTFNHGMNPISLDMDYPEITTKEKQ